MLEAFACSLWADHGSGDAAEGYGDVPDAHVLVSDAVAPRDGVSGGGCVPTPSIDVGGPLVPIGTAADVLGVSRASVSTLIAHGTLTAVRLPRRGTPRGTPVVLVVAR